jgi:hypothetical protein
MAEDNGVIGRLVAGAGGLALAVSVFLTWYSLNLADIVRGVAGQLPAPLSGQLSDVLGSIGGVTLSWSGWEGAHTIRFVLLLVGLAAVVSSLAPSTSASNRRPLVLLAGGLVAAVLAAYRIASPPGALDISVGPFQFPSPAGTATLFSHLIRVKAGAWVALLGGVLVMLGGWSQLATGRTAPAELIHDVTIQRSSKAPPGIWT